MSLLFHFCFETYDDDSMTEDIKIEKKVSGTERILKLNSQDHFQNYTKSFAKIDNIFELNNSNLNKSNKFLELKNSNICNSCGGKNCKYEDAPSYKNCAIKGLISVLFSGCIFSSQRPNTILIETKDLIKVFKENDIKLIVNCEIPGEHPSCGPNKRLELDNGYAYSPSLFIAEDIDVLNCGFQEDSVPFTLDFIIDVVKKISYIVKYKKGKVLVHGHSCTGRPCLVIICFLIYYFNKTAEEAINIVREKMKTAINDSQKEYIYKFEIYVNILKNIFIKKQIPIDKLIKYQMDMDFNFDNINSSSIISLNFKDKINEEILNMKYIPKILAICLDKIIQIKNINKITNGNLYKILNGLNTISKEQLKQLELIKKEINNNNWELLINNEDLIIITELLFSWMNENVTECINPKKIIKLREKFNSTFNNNKDNQNVQNAEKKNIFDEFLKGNHLLIKKDIYIFLWYFKIIFSKVEIEIIKYISLFLTLIYPILNKEDLKKGNVDKEYVRFIYKFCLFLLGYNLDRVNANTSKNNLKEKSDVKKLILIFEFFIFYVNKKDNEIKSTTIQNNNWFKNYLNLKSKNENENMMKNDNIMNFFKNKPKNNLISVKSFLIS